MADRKHPSTTRPSGFRTAYHFSTASRSGQTERAAAPSRFVQNLVPAGVTPIAFEDLQRLEHAVVGIDEAVMAFYYRAWGDDAHAVMDRLVSISRQKDLIILFVVHTLRKLDVALVPDAVVCREPSFMHARLERREVRAMTREVLEKFQALPVEQRKRHAYVVSHDIQGEMLTIELPEGWTEDLSMAFPGIAVEEGLRRPARQGPVERALETAAVAERQLARKFARDAETLAMIPHVPAREIARGPPVSVEGAERIGKEIDAVRRAFPRDLIDEEVIERIVAMFAQNQDEIEAFFKKQKQKKEQGRTRA